MGKGGKFTKDLTNLAGEPIDGYGKFNLLYLEIPVDLVYHIPAVIGNVYFGAGPYIAFGLGGKAKSFDASKNITTTQDITFGNDQDFKTGDAGINFLAGVKLKTGLLFDINYDLGITSMSTIEVPATYKNRTFSLSLGYAF